WIVLGPAVRPALLRPAAGHGRRSRGWRPLRIADRRGHRRRLHLLGPRPGDPRDLRPLRPVERGGDGRGHRRVRGPASPAHPEQPVRRGGSQAAGGLLGVAVPISPSVSHPEWVMQRALSWGTLYG